MLRKISLLLYNLCNWRRLSRFMSCGLGLILGHFWTKRYWSSNGLKALQKLIHYSKRLWGGNYPFLGGDEENRAHSTLLKLTQLPCDYNGLLALLHIMRHSSFRSQDCCYFLLNCPEWIHQPAIHNTGNTTLPVSLLSLLIISISTFRR